MALSVFFEGGTYRGGTALKASALVNKVITVERSDVMFEIARSTIGAVQNIVMLKGDTRDHLKSVLAGNDHILFWLDAHWSGGDTYGENDECPLLDELAIIFAGRRTCVILVDDARLFLAPPPKPHVLERWPTIKAISKIVPEDWDIVVYDDVIYILPGKVSLAFREFVQTDVTRRWHEGQKPLSFATKLKRAPGLIARRLGLRKKDLLIPS
jgi:hypothetical protein